MHIFENEITLGNRPILDEYMNSYEYKTSGLVVFLYVHVAQHQSVSVGHHWRLHVRDGAESSGTGRRGSRCRFLFSASHQDGNI